MIVLLCELLSHCEASRHLSGILINGRKNHLLLGAKDQPARNFISVISKGAWVSQLVSCHPYN